MLLVGPHHVGHGLAVPDDHRAYALAQEVVAFGFPYRLEQGSAVETLMDYWRVRIDFAPVHLIKRHWTRTPNPRKEKGLFQCCSALLGMFGSACDKGDPKTLKVRYPTTTRVHSAG